MTQQRRSLKNFRFLLRNSRVSWRDLAVTLGPILLLSFAAIWLAFRFVRPAPPDTLVITAGPPGSTYLASAERYRAILARSRIKLEILPSQGALDNLQRLADPSFAVDIGFVQGGVATGLKTDELVSLGSIFYEPLAIFYRADKPLPRLSALRGKRLAIGPEGSGTRALALTLLKTNGIEPQGPTQLLVLGGENAALALAAGQVDAAFLMGDSAAPPIMRKLVRMPGIRLFDFTQADGYVRRFRYLSKLEIPMGSIDFGKNLPRKDLALIGPTVELIARPSLHPALSDLLIETAREVHGGASLMQRAGEFPAPLEHEFRISAHADRYYKSGKSFLYRYMPFWLASLVDRMLVVLVPVIIVLIPGLRLAPWLYTWRIRSRMYRWYGALMALERDMLAGPVDGQRAELFTRLDEIEKGVNTIKMPLPFADQFYVLREHIRFVRNLLTERTAADRVGQGADQASRPSAGGGAG